MTKRRAEIWTLVIDDPIAAIAPRLEELGYDGIGFSDSQMSRDAFCRMMTAARLTTRIRLGTTVTNPVIRLPGMAAVAVATVHEESGGRAVLGLGRGDGAVQLIKERAYSVDAFARYIDLMQGYLRGEEVTLDNGHRARIEWIKNLALPKVPIDVAATGPRVITMAARRADMITFAVGADPRRLAWAMDLARQARRDAGLDPATLKFGAFVNAVAHCDTATARTLARGMAAVFAHFSTSHFSGKAGASAQGLSEEDKAALEEMNRRYDYKGHADSQGAHAQAMPDDFMDRFAIIGPPDACARRLQEVLATGLDRVVIIGPGVNATPAEITATRDLFGREVISALV